MRPNADERRYNRLELAEAMKSRREKGALGTGRIYVWGVERRIGEIPLRVGHRVDMDLMV